MLLSARLLNNVASVNDFEVVPVLESTAGDQADLYFQLIDASTEKNSNPPGRRYCPPAGSTLRLVIQSLNTNQTLTINCDQPFSEDTSIWRAKWPVPPFSNQSFDPAQTKGTFAFKLTLSQPGTTMPADWAIGTTYAIDVLVSYGGALWRSLQNANLGHVPVGGLSDVWWTQMTIVQPKVYSAFVSHALNIARTNPEF